MALTVGTNSYTTLADAKAYGDARPAWTVWAQASDAVLEVALEDAAAYLDLSYEWKGEIASETQAMAWERTSVTDKEGRTVTGVPPAVIKAQIEIANMALSGELVANAGSGELSALQAGSVSLTFKDGHSAGEGGRFRSIDRILTGLYKTRAGGGSINRKLSKA